MPDWTSRQAEGGVPADATFVTVSAEGDLSAETLLSSLALLKANNLSDVTAAATARTNLGLGTAATLNVGTAASNIVQLDGTAKMPAVDGSQLTNLPAAGIANVVEDLTPQLGGTLDANGKQVRLAKGADVASVAALALGTDGNYFDITGVIAITSIGTLGIGTVVTLHFDGILTLTHHAADLILPSGANIATAAGDEATFIEYAAGDWRCVNYTKANGQAVVGGVAGSDGQVQYNNGGVIGGAANLFYDDTNGNIGVGLSSFGTNGTKVVGVGVGVIPDDSPADGVQLYVQDVIQMANLVLLLNCNGVDAGITFTDTGPEAHVATANGNAQTDTAQQKFGTASGLFDGAGDYISIPDHADWDFLTGNFTVDLWVRFNSTAGAQALFEIGSYNNNTGILLQQSSGNLQVYINGGTIDKQVSWSPLTNTWYHIEMNRDASGIRLYIDGVEQGTPTANSESIGATQGVTIGARFDTAISPFNGWLDEIRVLNGRAAHTANFTPELAAYVPGNLAELKVRDEAGNITTLSPHNFTVIPEGRSEEMAWAHYGEKDGKRINVDMLKMARLVERLSGEKLVHIQ